MLKSFVFLPGKIEDLMSEFIWMGIVSPDHILHNLQQKMSTAFKIFMLLILLKNEDAIQMVYTWYIIMYRILIEFMPFTASKGNFVMFNMLILNLWR